MCDLLVVFTDVLFCFLFDGLAYVAHSITCLVLLFPTISRLFIIRAYVVEDIIDISRFSSALATLFAWTKFVMISVTVAMSSNSCSV